MLWPAAVLALLLLGFVVVYGSYVQSRVDALRRPHDGELDDELGRQVV